MTGFALALLAALHAELEAFAVLFHASGVGSPTSFRMSEDFLAIHNDFFKRSSIEVIIVFLQKLFSFL